MRGEEKLRREATIVCSHTHIKSTVPSTSLQIQFSKSNAFVGKNALETDNGGQGVQWCLIGIPSPAVVA